MYDIVCIKKVINVTVSAICERVNESLKPGTCSVTQCYGVRPPCAAHGRSRGEQSTGCPRGAGAQRSRSLPGTPVAQKLVCSSPSSEGPMTAVLHSVVFPTLRGGGCPGDSAAHCRCSGLGGGRRGGTASKLLDVRTSRVCTPYKTRAGICKPNSRFGRERSAADCTRPHNKNRAPSPAEG